ncbi:MAG: adenylate/guanylate cyclase domain-containing protein [Deltaproteobacteria bacterium]|nr:adenylate/guanylate cyclase domain-containing protein [Deltaproteobacteria bacterium]
MTDPCCAQCGAPLMAAARFCSQCGQAVPAGAAGESATGGERRQLTVVFSDLVGSTELASRLDPEEYQEFVATYYATCGDAVRAHDGHLAHLLGDGVLAYFGYPVAHEDSAQRAVRAALETQRALDALHDRCMARWGVAPVARVGIHTGVVVVGPVSAGEHQSTVALGDAMNIAARVQTFADPHAVVITATTHRLVAHAFSVEALGTHVLKGVPEPVALYRVRAALDARHQRAASARGRSTPFVGRGAELLELQQRWAAAQAGHGHAVLLTGEPGIGKSRLIHQLRHGSAPRWIEVTASPYRSHTAFGMLRQLLEDELAWPAEWSAEARLQDLERLLAGAGIETDPGARLLGALLDLPVDERYGRPLATAEQQRRRLIEIMLRWLRGLARDGAAILVLEDLHWADPSTLETLGGLIDAIAGDPLLLVMSARSEFAPPWPLGPHCTRLALAGLAPAEVRGIVAHVAAHLDPAGALIETLVDRTDGVPLFAEELARAVFERRADRGALERVPLTLNDSLLARLDRLGAAKEVAQVAAVIGRSFSRALLARLWPAGEDELSAGLATLVEADLLHPRAPAPHTTYEFTHALMQQAAYDSLLKRRRRELHAAVAQLLDASGDGPAELLAQHWTAAGDGARAVAAWTAAADSAFARSAFLEASAHFGEAIAALAQSPDSPERAGRELELQLRRATALQYGKGFVVPEAAAAVDRARELSERIGSAEQRLSTLLGIWTLSLSRGEITAAGELADQILAAAESSGRPGMLAQALTVQSGSRLHRCDLAGAIACGDRALALDVPDAEQLPMFLRAQPLLYSGIALALTGHADQARQRAARVLALKDAPAMGPFALVANLVIHAWLRDIETVRELEEQLRRETEQFQVPLFSAWGLLYGGWARALQGSGAAGIEAVRRGLAEHVDSGQRLGFTQYLGLLAEAQLAAGAIADGLLTIEEALGSRVSEERWHQAELLRLRAALLAARGDQASDVAAAYREAIATAQRDGTRLLERRAAIALARLLAAGGQRDEARALLAPLQASFSEGFDTSDHRDAAAVLAAL